MTTRQTERPAALRLEMSAFPAWACELSRPDGTTFKRFKSWDAAFAWMDRHGYMAPEQEVA